MSTDNYKWDKLDEPFAPDQIHWRVGQAKDGYGNNGPKATLLAYLTSRDVQDRLDDVFGKANWRNEYTEGADGGVKCTIFVCIGGEWVGKQDGAENTNIEAIKGGMSAALKRSAVMWGIGRYLYALDGSNIVGTPGYLDGVPNFKSKKEGKWFHFLPPTLPGWAIPSGWHHPDWKRASKRFCAALRESSGISYGVLADYLEQNQMGALDGFRRPSAMSLNEQQMLLNLLKDKALQAAIKSWADKRSTKEVSDGE